MRFGGERYDNFAEYGVVPFYNVAEIKPTPKRPEYELLREAVREQMRTDPVIQMVGRVTGCAVPLKNLPPPKL